MAVAILAGLATTLPSTLAAQAPPLTFSPTSLRFGMVLVGHSETQVVVVTNSRKTSTPISTITVSGSEFHVAEPKLPIVLKAQESIALKVTFSPSKLGYTKREVTFSDKQSHQTCQLAITGVGVKTEPLVATPASLSFGEVRVGTKATRTIVLRNEHSWKETVLRYHTTSRGFSVKGPDTPITLSLGQAIRLYVTFAPQSVGLEGSSVFIAGPSMDVPVMGTGTKATTVGQLIIAPSPLDFGSVNVGATTNEALTLSARGGNVTVASVASSNSEFAISGATFPLTIDAGKSTELDVLFSPTKSGTISGKLAFASDASSPHSSESLSGVGVLPEYSVNLSWRPSTSPVAGYNVYRGTTLGHYSRINTMLDQTTSYTDNTVVSGTIYYYAATAVSSKGEESGYCEPLKVTIP